MTLSSAFKCHAFVISLILILLSKASNDQRISFVTKSLSSHHYVNTAASNIISVANKESFKECQVACIKNRYCAWLTFPQHPEKEHLPPQCTLYYDLVPLTQPHNARKTSLEIAYVVGPRSRDIYADTLSCSEKKKIEDAYFCVISPPHFPKGRRSFPVSSTQVESKNEFCVISAFSVWDIQYEHSKSLPSTMNEISTEVTLGPMLNHQQQSLIVSSTSFAELISGVTATSAGSAPVRWKYHTDDKGRVTRVESGDPMDSSNLLPPGSRQQYCLLQYSDGFNKMMNPTFLDRMGLSAGHIIGCAFTNPQGMINFVVQTEETNMGCYNQAEATIAAMLGAGCRMKLASKLTYSQSVSAASVSFTEKERMEHCRSKLIPTSTNFVGRVLDGSGICEHLPDGLLTDRSGMLSILNKDKSISRVVLQWLISVTVMNSRNVLGFLQNELGLCYNRPSSSTPVEVLNMIVSLEISQAFMYFSTNGVQKYYFTVSQNGLVVPTQDFERAVKLNLSFKDFITLVSCQAHNLATFYYQEQVYRVEDALRRHPLSLVSGQICTEDASSCAEMTDIGENLAGVTYSGQSATVFSLSYTP